MAKLTLDDLREKLRELVGHGDPPEDHLAADRLLLHTYPFYVEAGRPKGAASRG
jgi:hypothetical protein